MHSQAVQISHNCDLENSHCWLARLENVEELLSLFYARVYKADSNRQYVLQLINDLIQDQTGKLGNGTPEFFPDINFCALRIVNFLQWKIFAPLNAYVLFVMAGLAT